MNDNSISIIFIEISVAEQSKLWLVHNRDKEEVIRHWELSYPLRKADCKQKENNTIFKILEKWPILKESRG